MDTKVILFLKIHAEIFIKNEKILACKQSSRPMEQKDKVPINKAAYL